MFCSKCGKSVEDGQAFCPACGTKLGGGVEPAVSTPAPAAKKKGGCLKIILWVVFIIGGVVAIVSNMDGESSGAGSSGGSSSASVQNTPIETDPAKMTGMDLVRGNAQKDSGYTDAQLQNLAKKLQGRELTFTNGEIQEVTKDDDTGKTVMIVDFDAPDGGMFDVSFTVHATVNSAQSEEAQDLDAGSKIKSLKGTVYYDSDFFAFFELRNASFTK